MAGEGIAQPRGDAPARIADFDELVAMHEPRIRRLAHRLLGWNGDVDDIVQDVFLAALARIEKFRGEASIATWLTSVTINRCRTDRRRRFLRLRWLARHPKSEAAQPADQRSMDDEISARVRSAVGALQRKDREVIVLFYLENCSAQQIAELLEISRGAVEVRLHRARARLKQQLAEFMKD
jgi:RNA polymerase sigma factor (sigma-70 family)